MCNKPIANCLQLSLKLIPHFLHCMVFQTIQTIYLSNMTFLCVNWSPGHLVLQSTIIPHSTGPSVNFCQCGILDRLIQCSCERGASNNRSPSPCKVCLSSLIRIGPVLDKIDIFVTQHIFTYLTCPCGCREAIYHDPPTDWLLPILHKIDFA